MFHGDDRRTRHRLGPWEQGFFGWMYGGWLRNPNHQLIGGLSYPIIYRVSTIQGDTEFRNHPQYGG